MRNKQISFQNGRMLNFREFPLPRGACGQQVSRIPTGPMGTAPPVCPLSGAWPPHRDAAGARHRPHQNSSPFFSSPCTPFSPFTVWVTWKSTASEQNW